MGGEMIELDCGDNSCMFAKKKVGMRTNSGCQCFCNNGFSKSAVRAAYELLPALLEARKLAEEFASEITRLRCNRTDTTAFSGRPKLPWEEK
jgi:hypothetical protein